MTKIPKLLNAASFTDRIGNLPGVLLNAHLGVPSNHLLRAWSYCSACPVDTQKELDIVGLWWNIPLKRMIWGYPPFYETPKIDRKIWSASIALLACSWSWKPSDLVEKRRQRGRLFAEVHDILQRHVSCLQWRSHRYHGTMHIEIWLKYVGVSENGVLYLEIHCLIRLVPIKIAIWGYTPFTDTPMHIPK